MQVRLAVLADYANVTSEGKVNIMGMFGELNPPELPFTLPQCFIVLELSASPAESGTKRNIRIVLLGDDGNKVLDIGGEVVVPQSPRDGHTSNVVSMLGIANLTFDRAGAYHFSVMVNDDEKTTIPLFVRPPMKGSDNAAAANS